MALWSLRCTKLPGDVNQQTDTSAVVLDEQYLSDKPPCNLGAEATFKRYITQINNITPLPAGDLSPPALQQYTAAATLSKKTSGHFDYSLKGIEPVCFRLLDESPDYLLRLK